MTKEEKAVVDGEISDILKDLKGFLGDHPHPFQDRVREDWR